MSTNDGSPEHSSEVQLHEIRVEGHLDPRWGERLAGLTVKLEGDGTTTLSGPVVDQAALHGLLGQIRDLGLPIVSIRRLPSATEERTA